MMDDSSRQRKIEMVKKGWKMLESFRQEQLERRKQWESFKSMMQKWRGIIPNRLDV